MTIMALPLLWPTTSGAEPLPNSGVSKNHSVLDHLAVITSDAPALWVALGFIFTLGGIIYLLVSNILRRRRLELRINSARQRQDELQEIVDRSGIIIIQCRPETNWPIEMISSGIESYGYTPEELQNGKVCLHDLIHPEDREKVAAEAQCCIANQDCSHFAREYRLLKKDGEARWVVERIWLERDKEGRVLQFEGALHDIHARRIAKEKLADYRNRLEEIIKERTHELLQTNDQLTCEVKERAQAEERLQQLVQFQHLITAISTSFINLDADAADTTIEEQINGSLFSLCQLLDLDRASLYLSQEEGQYFDLGYEWHGEHIPELSPELREIGHHLLPGWILPVTKLDPVQILVAETTGERRRELTHFTEIPNIQHVGVIPLIFRRTLFGFLVLSSSRATNLWNDETLALLQILGEIFTGALEHKWTEQALIKSERMAAVGTLSGGIAHEFNNINTSILGYSEICLEMLEEGHECYEFLNYVYNSAIRARDLTRNLLTFSGQELGEYEMDSLTRVAEETLSLISRQLESDGVHVTRSLEEIPKTQMDCGQVGQVILNLLINASHAVHGQER
ncbi:MAG: sensor histidine kinase, partial [Planctomycetota bacterium]